MTFRFLHLADLHLDSAYGGRAETRARLRSATFEALENAARFAIADGLDAVLIAGDAYDDDRLGVDARSVLRRELRRLGDAGVRVVLVTGNHDPGGPGFAAPRLGLDRLPNVDVALGAEPRTVTIERDGRVLAHVVACGHETARTTDDLASLMTPRPGSAPSVALLHTQVSSARGAGGHEPYAPASPATLAASGFAYWALGHVHVRGRATPDAPAWYCGNLVGRNARETGPKGGLVVEVDGGGLVGTPRFVPFAPVEFLRCAVDAPAAAEPESVALAALRSIEAALDARGAVRLPEEVVLRIVLEGPRHRALDAALEDWSQRAAFADAVREEIGAELTRPALLEVELRTATARSEATPAIDLDAGPSALREALRLARELEEDPSRIDELDVDWSLAQGATANERRARAAALASGLADELLRRAGGSAGLR